jgi:hypothetical protein
VLQERKAFKATLVRLEQLVLRELMELTVQLAHRASKEFKVRQAQLAQLVLREQRLHQV